jgi:hypothetical protein
MKRFQRLLFLFILFNLFGFTWPWDVTVPNPNDMSTNQWVQTQTRILKAKASNINTEVLRLSLIAYSKARKRGLDQKQILTVIDYSKPSYEKRLWVFDMRSNKTLYNTWVSHGKNSGDVYATSFSNRVHSLQSSIGVFLTEETYFGGLGYALRLNGLEPGINDNALRRATVMHGARYVNAETVRRYGRVGRSWGCPAVSTDLVKPIINTIKNNTLVFAYYPDRHWLSHSRYLMA